MCPKRKSDRYTVSEGFSLGKVKHKGKVQNPRFGIHNPETFPTVVGVSTRVPEAVRRVALPKLIGIAIGWDLGLRCCYFINKDSWNCNVWRAFVRISRKSRAGIQYHDTFPTVVGASTRVPEAVRGVPLPKLIGIAFGWDVGLRYCQNWDRFPWK